METSISKFQFKGYRINRSLIELDENSNFENLKIAFAVSGLVKRVENLFILNLSIKIKNNENNLNIEVDTIANFLFERVENVEDISGFFYNNSSMFFFASSILFSLYSICLRSFWRCVFKSCRTSTISLLYTRARTCDSHNLAS